MNVVKVCCWAVVGSSLTTAGCVCLVVTLWGRAMYRGMVTANATAVLRPVDKDEEWWV